MVYILYREQAHERYRQTHWFTKPPVSRLVPPLNVLRGFFFNMSGTDDSSLPVSNGPSAVLAYWIDGGGSQ